MDAERELVPLKDAGDLEIADEQSDARGWPVFGRDGERIGRVEELLADPDALEVRALDVGLDEDVLGAEGAGQHLVVPLGQARLERERRRVVLGGVDRGDVARLAARGSAVDRDDAPDRRASREDAAAEERASREEMVAARDDRGRAARAEAEALEDRAARTDAREERIAETRIPRTEEQLELRRRLEETGDVQVHKRVDTEHVARDIDARREDYDVQRVPAEEVNASAPAEGEIRIPIVEEEIVVEKRPVVREVLVLRKRVVTETRRVEADLRREHVEVERRGRTGDDAERSASRAEGREDEVAGETDHPIDSGADT